MHTVRLASDLHLEGFSGTAMDKIENNFLPKHSLDAESVLVLAGDISSNVTQLAQFLKHIEKRFVRVVYIPGNHEFYHHNIANWGAIAHTEFGKYALENTWTPYDRVGYTIIDGVRYIAGTLWGEGSYKPEYNKLIERGLADFHVIENMGKNFTVGDMQQMSRRHKSDILSTLNRSFDGKTVVVTHHMPSYECVAERFSMSAINGGWVTECMELITSEIVPDVWLHGHTHDQIDKIVLGEDFKLRIVCNPAGYRHEWDTVYNEFFVEPKFLTL